ncbi:MAG: serine hydrolase [Alphaproteobacteria bacterium]|nr:serine hydrolase [Alphaproteobacteria bacterium]
MRPALLALLPLLALSQELPEDGPDTPPFTDEAVEPAPTVSPEGCALDRTWPTEAWPERAPGPDKADAVAALEAYAFPERTPEQEAERLGVRTDGVIVIQGGEILYERYGDGYTAEMPHLNWSVSKTWVSALVALAVAEGRMSVEDSICDHITATNPENCVIRVQDLLEFASGLEWHETYEGDPPTTSSVIAMLIGEGYPDMAAFISGQPRRAPPGTVWQYSSGDTTLLANVVQAVMEPEHGRDFPWTLLFDRLGMTSVVFERDNAGTFVGSSYLHATPRDMARFGYLWLNDGCWEGERLFPEGWVLDSTRVSDAIRARALDRGPRDVQGRQLWLNQPVPELGDETRPWPDMPSDTYAAMGHWKQAIVMVPSRDAVIIRTGDDRDGSFSWNTFLSLSLALTDEIPMGGLGYRPAVGEPGVMEASEAMKFDVGLLGLGTAYGAKLGCTCAYVIGQTHDYCRAYIKASPDIVKAKFDDEAHAVTTRAMGFKTATARWVNERDGCLLDP